jgi:hypothetical protein
MEYDAAGFGWRVLHEQQRKGEGERKGEEKRAEQSRAERRGKQHGKKRFWQNRVGQNIIQKDRIGAEQHRMGKSRVGTRKGRDLRPIDDSIPSLLSVLKYSFRSSSKLVLFTSQKYFTNR